MPNCFPGQDQQYTSDFTIHLSLFVRECCVIIDVWKQSVTLADIWYSKPAWHANYIQQIGSHIVYNVSYHPQATTRTQITTFFYWCHIMERMMQIAEITFKISYTFIQVAHLVKSW